MFTFYRHQTSRHCQSFFLGFFAQLFFFWKCLGCPGIFLLDIFNVHAGSGWAWCGSRPENWSRCRVSNSLLSQIQTLKDHRVNLKWNNMCQKNANFCFAFNDLNRQSYFAAVVSKIEKLLSFNIRPRVAVKEIEKTQIHCYVWNLERAQNRMQFCSSKSVGNLNLSYAHATSRNRLGHFIYIIIFLTLKTV